MKQHNYFVYITTNPSKSVLYVGMTNNLSARLFQHYENRGSKSSFAGKFYCFNLVYWERHTYVNHAIDREKEIKKWHREKKVKLIEEFNPQWRFLNGDIG